jgi:hypothetical protein
VNLADLYNKASKYRDENPDSDDRWEPPAGLDVLVEVVKTGVNTAKASGDKSIWYLCKVVDPSASDEVKGKAFIESTYFSSNPDHAFILARGIAQLEAFGIAPAVFQANPSIESLAALLVGKQARVKTAYSSKKDKNGKAYRNFKYVPVGAGTVTATTAPTSVPVPAPQPEAGDQPSLPF